MKWTLTGGENHYPSVTAYAVPAPLTRGAFIAPSAHGALRTAAHYDCLSHFFTELCAGEDVKMQMGHALAAVITAVGDDPKAV